MDEASRQASANPPSEQGAEGASRSGEIAEVSIGEQSEVSQPSGTKNLRILGSLQVLQGITFCAFGIFLNIDLSVAFSTGAPWWNGAVMIVAGCLTIASEKYARRRHLVRACLAANIIVTIVTVIAALIYSIDLTITVVFEMIYLKWALAFTAKLVFLVYTMASLGISLAVLVILRRELSPRKKGAGGRGQTPAEPIETGGISSPDTLE